MKLTPLLLLIPLAVSSLFATSVSAQEENCTWIIQGELEESDPKIQGTNARYDVHMFTAERGDEIFVEAESTYFKSEIALFQITDGNVFTMIDRDRTPTDWQLFTAWIYEDGEYAIRVTSVEYDDASYKYIPTQRFGYYTLQISPFVCD